MVEVIALYVFASFEELYADLPLKKCGYTINNIKTASAADMNEYYFQEEQLKYGVVGIEFEVKSKI